MFEYSCENEMEAQIELVFVKDTSLYFTNHVHERRRREIVITSVKHKNSTTTSAGAINKT